MVFTGLSSALTFMKRKRVDIVSGSLFLAGNLPGALLGVYLNQYIQSGLFELLLGFLMLVIVGLFFIKKYLPQRQYDENHEKKTHIHRKFLIAGYEVKYSFSVILGILVGFICRNAVWLIWHRRWIIDGSGNDFIIWHAGAYRSTNFHVYDFLFEFTIIFSSYSFWSYCMDVCISSHSRLVSRWRIGRACQSALKKRINRMDFTDYYDHCRHTINYIAV